MTNSITNTQIRSLYELVKLLHEKAKQRVDRYNAEYNNAAYFDDTSDIDRNLQYWRGSNDAYKDIIGHIIKLMKQEDNPETRYIHETYELFHTDDGLYIICPKCGRKRPISREDGDMRGVIHCRCKTGGKTTVFKESMGAVHEYTDEQGVTMLL